MKTKPPTKRQIKKISKFLAPGEQLIVATSIGDRYFWSKFITYFPLALILIGLPKFTGLIRMRQSYTYALTSRRFLIIRGIFSRKIVTAPLSAITHVTVEQSFSQRFFYNCGHLVIITAGFDQREIVIENIGDPVNFKIMIEELTERLDWPKEDETKIEDEEPKKPRLKSLEP